MRVLVTGGAGYIGSHTVVALSEGGHDVAVVDNLSNSSSIVVERIAQIVGQPPRMYVLDIRDRRALTRIFATENPDAVIHFAGLKSVAESLADPLEYYAHNLDATFSLLSVMREVGPRRLVFSSSATVYGGGQEPPYSEEDEPFVATNPYGETKVMSERILSDLVTADPEWRVAILRYFNPIGAHPSGLIGEDPQGTPNNIAPYIAQVAVGRRKELTVFGDDYETRDGTGERDYIHVNDLAAGHVAALAWLTKNSGLATWNLGTGVPTTVLELIRAFEEASGVTIPYRIGPRRPGDLPSAWADVSRAKAELGWRAAKDLRDMASDAWRWQSHNPLGYRDTVER